MSVIIKYFDEYFHLMKFFVQSWPVLGWPSQQASESKLELDTLTNLNLSLWNSATTTYYLDSGPDPAERQNPGPVTSVHVQA